jgi:hypothetical protein
MLLSSFINILDANSCYSSSYNLFLNVFNIQTSLLDQPDWVIFANLLYLVIWNLFPNIYYISSILDGQENIMRFKKTARLLILFM